MTIHMNLNVVDRLIGNNVEVTNTTGIAKIALAKLIPLILDKGTNNVQIYSDNSGKLVITIAGIDSVYLNNTDFRFVNNPRFLQNLAGLKTNAGTEYLVILEPSISSADFKNKIQSASNKIVLLAPGVYTVSVDCQNAPIDIPSGCTIIAYGSTINLRSTHPSGSWYWPFFRTPTSGSCAVLGGLWYLDYSNSTNVTSAIFNPRGDCSFLDCTIDGWYGIRATAGRVKLTNLVFQPQNTLYSRAVMIAQTDGATYQINNCLFEGFAVGTTTRAWDAGAYLWVRNARTIFGNAVFRHLLVGANVIIEDGWGANQRYVHLYNIDCVEMANGNQGGNSPIQLSGNTSSVYYIEDVTIENVFVQGGGVYCGQIGTVWEGAGWNGAVAMKNLNIRNVTLVASSPYGTARHGLYFPNAGLTEISEISNVTIKGTYGVSPIKIHSSIPIGKFDVKILL